LHPHEGLAVQVGKLGALHPHLLLKLQPLIVNTLIAKIEAKTRFFIKTPLMFDIKSLSIQYLFSQ